MRFRFALPLAWLLGCALVACAPGLEVPQDFLVQADHEDPTRPLGGEALAQRKVELRRAQSDMVHFFETLESLRHRKDRNGFFLFSAFCDEYIGTHLNPLLGSQWQSDHPELMGLDANLRLIKAAVLMQMREPRRAQREIDEIARRFQGREDVLVESPLGGQTTLKDALRILSEEKWRS